MYTRTITFTRFAANRRTHPIDGQTRVRCHVRRKPINNNSEFTNIRSALMLTNRPRRRHTSWRDRRERPTGNVFDRTSKTPRRASRPIGNGLVRLEATRIFVRRARGRLFVRLGRFRSEEYIFGNETSPGYEIVQATRVVCVFRFCRTRQLSIRYTPISVARERFVFFISTRSNNYT